MIALQFARYGPPDVLFVGDAPPPHAAHGEIRISVRAAGVTPADGRLRAGLFSAGPLPLPHIPGVDAAGVVDEIGDDVTGVALGDAVFGLVDLARLGGASAEFAVLSHWAAKPKALSWEQAGGAATSIETATRTLDELRATAGTTLLIEGAAGGVGTVVVQLARARGARVIGTASEPNHKFLTGLGAVPTTYGAGLVERVAVLAPDGVDAVLDVVGSGSLPDLVAIAGEVGRVVSIADFSAPQLGVHMSHSGPGGTEMPGYGGLLVASELATEGRFTVPLHAVLPLVQAAEAHELSATGHARGKIVLTVP